MAEIRDHINVRTLLQLASAPRPSFGTQLFLVDDDQIPEDVRYIYVTPGDYKDSLATDTVPREYADVYFGGDLTPDKLMIGRWISTATSPKYIAGPGIETDYTVWQAVDGSGGLKVVDDNLPTPNEDEVLDLDFSAITAYSQVPIIIETALQSIAAPNITGLNSATCFFDALDRLVIKMPGTGSAEASIHLEEATTGDPTDILPLLDNDNAKSVAGQDAEGLDDACQAISVIDDSYYNIHERGGSEDQKKDLATWVETEVKLCDLVTDDADVKDPAVTDDIGSALKDLGRKRSLVIYTEKLTDQSGGGLPTVAAEYPDAAAASQFLPATEGTKQFEWTSLAGVTDSGYPNNLNVGDRLALSDKNVSYIEDYGTTKILYNGLTAGGVEKRIMLGKDWFDANHAFEIFDYQVKAQLAAFDNETLTALEGITRGLLDEALRRRITIDTEEYPILVNYPDADEITQAERDTREFKRGADDPIYRAKLNTAIHDYDLIGIWEQ